MVDEDLGQDLLSFGTPVLVLGDPAQLPPVKGGGFFTEAEPDIMLTEVHRQAADNPIVRMSMIDPRGRAARCRRLRPQPRHPPRRRQSRDRARRRPGAGRHEQDAAQLQCPHAPADGPDRDRAGGGRKAGLPAQRQEQGPAQWRLLDRAGAEDLEEGARHHAGDAGGRQRRQAGQGLGAAELLRRHRGGGRPGSCASTPTSSPSATP